MKSDDIIFKCKKCGNCCRDKDGYVYPETAEIRMMAEKLGMEEFEFRRTYLVTETELVTHVKSRADGTCIFLEGDRCRIYDFRPKQCATYPFWPQNFSYRSNFDRLLKECPGVKLRSSDKENDK